MNTKICSLCKIEKKASEFAKCKTHKDGLQHQCKECKHTIMKNWRTQHPEYSKTYYIDNTERMKGNQIKRYRTKKNEEPWYIAYCNIKQRAHEKQLEFNLDAEYIKSIWTDICPILGIPLYCAVFESGLSRTQSKAKPMDNSPTIDRMDPNKGYVKGNVCVMSYRANMIKNCGSLEEHEKIVAFLKSIKTTTP